MTSHCERHCTLNGSECSPTQIVPSRQLSFKPQQFLALPGIGTVMGPSKEIVVSQRSWLFLIYSIFIELFLIVSISVLKFPICSCKMSPFSTRYLNMFIIVMIKSLSDSASIWIISESGFIVSFDARFPCLSCMF